MSSKDKITDEMKEKLLKIEETRSTLDEHCIKLLSIFHHLYTHNLGKELGFNELYREITKTKDIKGLKSKKILALHLKHLLEKNLVEVREETESNLMIKPRKYRLSTYWMEVADILFPRIYSLCDYEKALKVLKPAETETLTVILSRFVSIECTELFKQSLVLPYNLATGIRETIYDAFENLAEVYRTLILERNEEEKALKTIEEFRGFLIQKIEERYPSFRKIEEEK